MSWSCLQRLLHNDSNVFPRLQEHVSATTAQKCSIKTQHVVKRHGEM